MPTMSPRKCVYRVFGVKANRTDGRFFAFAQNDMLLQSSNGETCPSGLGTTCHPEDGTYLKVGRTFLSARLNSWHGNGERKKTRPVFSRTVVPWKAKGRRRLRGKCVYCIFTLRPIEKTGDSSTSLRMTCFAITIGETCVRSRHNLSS